MSEKTLVLLKPDAMQRQILGQIIERFERKGLQIVGMKMFKADDAMLRDHYSHLVDKPFFGEIADFMKIGPMIALCLAGLDVVSTVRTLCGITKAREAAPGTIRGDFAMSIQANLVHASDSVESAQAEIARFFKPEEIFSYGFHNKEYVYSTSEQKNV